MEEARALLDELRETLRKLQQEKQELDDLRQQLRKLSPVMRSNGHSVEAAELDMQIRSRVDEMRAELEALMERGILVKDLDQGIVDFPHQREGKIVLLCWQIDEPDIHYWHDIDAGFNGRQPL